jgi:glycosyltransferase involved in cell wall biosynthesis
VSRPKVLFANGTGEGQAVTRRFDYIQLLTPQAFNAWQAAKPPGQDAFLVPNFIDTNRFTPGDREQARAALNPAPTGPLVLCCAAIRRYHKRIDYLLSEFAAALPALPRGTSLLIAGGTETDTSELIGLGTRLLGEKVRFLTDVPREQMPLLYRAADLFVLPSLSEMFGIVLLEAMASGVPVLCHDTPDFRFVAGAAGCYRDIAQPGALAAALVEAMHPNVRQELAKAARPHVEQRFSAAAIVTQIVSIYAYMLDTSHDARVG